MLMIVCEVSERGFAVDAETEGAVVFLSQTKQRMGNFWGNARSRDAASPEEAGLRNRPI